MSDSYAESKEPHLIAGVKIYVAPASLGFWLDKPTGQIDIQTYDRRKRSTG